ncbi:universal stress protein [Mucilaginibacter auburnensis]|uniref:Nucleotide-binding universal stress UspA family protein n=1 Tax=Mucilaginibacter auburnensis TaxID=1457233 RepID=A0A2H9VTW8_9SPHI|nr:universal stress protein [Mucilaginibacter auburnensis]PJJ84273.1 nucleotide-binding universal stress UspA family protein [Mucilaginibacter auburnensis]
MKIKKVLIGIDNSNIAEHAAQYGFELAVAFKAEVGLVNVVEPIVAPMGGSIDPMGGTSLPEMTSVDAELMDIQNQSSKKLVDRIADEFGAGLSVTHFTEFGDTADGILQACAEFNADVIVVGTHSRSGLDRLLMGSVAEHVVRHAMVPVFVVPLPHHEE